MYSMDALLHLVHSDGADELRLRVGQPPVVILDQKPQPLEGPALTSEDVNMLLRSVATTRRRRELMEKGRVRFLHLFRERVKFVVRARIEAGNVEVDIH
jgi:Tfp pilus assembly ATPase PilU